MTRLACILVTCVHMTACNGGQAVGMPYGTSSTPGTVDSPAPQASNPGIASPQPSPTVSSSPAPSVTATPTPTPSATVDPTVPNTPVTGPPLSVHGYGAVTFYVDASTTVTDLTTTLTVPPTPSSNQSTLFLWPGLQPGGANYDPIDNGVLQPVLTWGSSCAPGTQPLDYSTWWVSSQYVNTFGHASGYSGCYGGSIMSVSVGDALLMHFYLQGTIWTQDVTNTRTGQVVTFSIDMQNQAQNYPEFIIESYGPEPTTDVIFSNTTYTFGASSPSSCWPTVRGTDDYVSTPRVSPDGMHCAVDLIVLRAQGVPATDPHAPGP